VSELLVTSASYKVMFSSLSVSRGVRSTECPSIIIIIIIIIIDNVLI